MKVMIVVDILSSCVMIMMDILSICVMMVVMDILSICVMMVVMDIFSICVMMVVMDILSIANRWKPPSKDSLEIKFFQLSSETSNFPKWFDISGCQQVKIIFSMYNTYIV